MPCFASSLASFSLFFFFSFSFLFKKKKKIQVIILKYFFFGLFFSLVFTNVPGPQKEASLAGYSVADMMFYVPTPVGTVLSVLTYNQQISLGVLADPKVRSLKFQYFLSYNVYQIK